MSTIAPPPLPPNPALANSEGYIDEQIRRTRRSLKLLDLGAGVLTLTIGLLAFVLVGALLDHWIIPGGLNVAGRATLFALMLAGLAWYGWRQFIPLLKPINPVYAAQTIEQNAPSLKNSLLNLLLFRSHRNYLSARVYHALEQQTAAKLSKASLEASIDRSALLRLGYALLAIITVCALYALLSPKSLGLSTVRVLAPWSDVTPPSRVQILDVKPGSTSVARGERVEISAQIDGLSNNEPVRLRYSTADEQTVDESIRMERPSPEARRFEGFLPRGTDSGVMQDLTYWIEAGDARTEKFKLSVFERPTIVVQKIHYDYPRYTGLPPKDSVQNGDVKGLDGTEVTISALASQPIKTASLDFDADGSNDRTMTVEGDRATVRFKLGFRDGSSTPLHPKYALRFTTADGRANADPTVHSIEVTRDLGPEISITDPEEKEQVARVSDLLTVGVEARDPDYGLKRVAIMGKVNDGAEQPLFEMLEKVHTGRFGAIKTYTPGELGLKPGDLLEYWAVAEDSRPEANTAFTDHYRLKIIGPDKPQAGQQPPNNGGQQQPDNKQGGENGEQGGQGGGGGGQGGESGGESGESQSGAGGSSGGQGESGESQGEQQQGQGGGGAGDNESGESEESSDKAGQSGGGSGGEGEESSENQSSQGNSQGSNRGQSGGKEQESSSGESKPGEAGQQGDSADQQAGGEQSKVASGGEDDGTAFQRMAEHMGEQEGAGEGKPNPSQQGQGQQTEQAQAGESAGEQGEENNTPQQGAESAQQTNGQGGKQQKPQAGAAGKQQEGATADEAQDAANQTNQGEQNGESPEQSSTGAAQGSQKGSNQKPQADGAQPQGPNQKATDTEQKTDAAGDNPSKREGANIPEEAKPGDGNPEDQQSGQDPGSDSEMNRNNGNSGSGHSAGEKEGAPGNDKSMRQGRDKQDEDNRPGQDDQEPPSGSGDKKESNSKGGQSGEQSGGGKQGAGQKADAAGKGGSGQHEAADQGAGKAEEQGEGETGTNAGNQQQADGKTGQSSGDQPGNGSQQGETGENQPSEGDQQPGEQGGQSPSAGGQGQGSSSGKQQPQSNEQPSGEQPQGGQQPGGQSGGGEQSANESKSEGDKPGDPADKQQPNNSTGTGGSQPIGGGTGSNAMSSPSTESGQLGADDPNLDYAKKQTDLVLERLDEQLAKKQVDQTLLKKLGWTEDELQRFVDRWKNLKASAAGEGEAPNEAKQELDDTLRNLLPRSNGPLKFRGQAKADDLRSNDALRVKPPSEYADRVREYTKGISSQRKD